LAQTPNHSRPKPVVDEASFEQLLAAACMMQEHNDRLRAHDPLAAPSETLSEIVELQGRIQSRSLDFKAAANMIVEELSKNTLASGVAVAMLAQDHLTYLAASGEAAPYIGQDVPREEAASAECLLTGKIQLCTEANPNGGHRTSFCRRANIQSYIAAPIRRHASVVGTLELWFAETGDFPERDIRVCELMAVLLSEARAQSSPNGNDTIGLPEPEKTQEGGGKRGVLLEKFSSELPPFLGTDMFQSDWPEQESDRVGSDLAGWDSLGEQAASQNLEPYQLFGEEFNASPPPVGEPRSALPNLDPDPAQGSKQRNEEVESRPPAAKASDSAATKLVCRGCGKRFEGEEAFCGNCGVSRIAAKSEEGYLQHKWATLWYMQEAVRRRELRKGDADSEIAPATPSAPAETKIRDLTPSPSPNGLLRSPTARAWSEVPAGKLELNPPQLASKPHPAAEASLPAKSPTVGDDASADDDDSNDDDAIDNGGDSHEEWNKQGELPAHALERDHDGTVAEHPEMHAEPASAALWVSPVRATSLDSLRVEGPSLGSFGVHSFKVDSENSDSEEAPVVETAEPVLPPSADARVESPPGGTPKAARLREQWHSHRATVYLSAAVVLLIVAIFGWGAPAADQGSANPQDSPASRLTALDKLLIASGLAEAPEQPREYPGNPDAQVWLDVHTALYYCPGASLYGKTSGGRVAAQRSAQLDQFEPASHKACD
jgi:hypothetical protein